MHHLSVFVLLAVFASDLARKIVDENSQEDLWEAVKHRYVQWNLTIKDGSDLIFIFFPTFFSNTIVHNATCDNDSSVRGACCYTFMRIE